MQAHPLALLLSICEPDWASRDCWNPPHALKSSLSQHGLLEGQSRGSSQDGYLLVMERLVQEHPGYQWMPPSSEGHHWADPSYLLSHGTGGTLNVLKAEGTLTS